MRIEDIIGKPLPDLGGDKPQTVNTRRAMVCYRCGKKQEFRTYRDGEWYRIGVWVPMTCTQPAICQVELLARVNKEDNR